MCDEWFKSILTIAFVNESTAVVLHPKWKHLDLSSRMPSRRQKIKDWSFGMIDSESNDFILKAVDNYSSASWDLIINDFVNSDFMLCNDMERGYLVLYGLLMNKNTIEWIISAILRPLSPQTFTTNNLRAMIVFKMAWRLNN